MPFDPEILALIPHRPPMLLINELTAISASAAQTRVSVEPGVPFYCAPEGVPAWVGLEYMGQTAALIAGYQQREGLSTPHLGFLLGCRTYQATQGNFKPFSTLVVDAVQETVVGESLATFNCTITDLDSKSISATALLSVFRQPLNK